MNRGHHLYPVYMPRSAFFAPPPPRSYPRHMRANEPSDRMPGHSMSGEPYESYIQCEIVKYLRNSRPDIWFTATVGGVNVSNYQRKQMIRQGYSKGVPDLILFLKDGVLAVEVKRPKTFRITIEQREWEVALTERGHAHAYVHSLPEFIEVLRSVECSPVISIDIDQEEGEGGETNTEPESDLISPVISLDEGETME